MCTVRLPSLAISISDDLCLHPGLRTLPTRFLWLVLYGLRFVLLDLVFDALSATCKTFIGMESGRPPLMQGVFCINCNIRLNTCNAAHSYHVLQLDIRVISVFTTWVAPLIITEEDYVCNECYNLAIQSVNSRIHTEDGCDPGAGSSRYGHQQVCLICGRSVANRQSHSNLLEGSGQNLTVIQIIENRIAPRQISHHDRCCHACWMHASRQATRNQHIDEERDLNVEIHYETPQEMPSVASTDESQQNVQVNPVSTERPHTAHHADSSTVTLLHYRRAPNTASRCIFAQCESVTNLHTVSNPLRKTLFHTYKYYVPVLARICTDHLQRNSWDCLYDAPNTITSFTAEQIEHIFSLLSPYKPYLDFSSLESVQRIDNHLFGYWLGLIKENFISLLNALPRIHETPRGILGLAAMLIKMRTGDSDDRLSTLLEVPRTTLERLMKNARNIMLEDFVPRNLGINHKTRNDLLRHNLMIPNGIYNENNLYTIIICDGTYIFLNKSSNFMFQKDTYSLHKYRNLLKPFLLVTCDGYIQDCFGPYKATTSDADIMTSLFQDENSPLRQYFQNNDVFILDRGFRDSINLLQQCNYRAYMPESLLQGEHQLTTAQANRNRCVTLCRWVVEVVNGYFKRDYRLFRFDHFNKTVPHMFTYFKIAAALLNKFGVRLVDRVDAEPILNVLRERMPLQNNLASVVSELNLNRRASLFTSMTENNDVIFPRLEYNELILFALGTYQIRLARSYYAEHIRSQGVYIIEVSREVFDVHRYHLRGSGENSLIRARIKSRHVGRRQYYVYILIENNVDGREGIIEYSCSCLVGRRTVGCCAHVMSIVWYLGWARHQDNIVPPATFLDDVIVRDID